MTEKLSDHCENKAGRKREQRCIPAVFFSWEIQGRTKMYDNQEEKMPLLGYETVFNNSVTVFGKNDGNPVKCTMVTLPESLYMENLDEMINENHKKSLQFW